MENLNAEQVKKDLKELMFEAYASNGAHKPYLTMRDALALINSQEQRIGELIEEKSKVFEKSAENLTRLEEAYLKIEAENLKLTEEKERLRGVKEEYETFIGSLKPRIDTAKADTVRKMQERFKEKVAKYFLPSFQYQVNAFIDQIAKEVLEDGI